MKTEICVLIMRKLRVTSIADFLGCVEVDLHYSSQSVRIDRLLVYCRLVLVQ